MTKTERKEGSAPSSVDIGSVSAGRDVRVSTRNTYISMLPGGRRFWMGLLSGLIAIAVITTVTLEDYACDRFSLCLVSYETLTRMEPLSADIAIVELQKVRTEPVVEATDDGILITGSGTEALFVSAVPIGQQTRLRFAPATAEDMRIGVQRVAALPPAKLAALTKEHAPLLKAHNAVFEPLERSLRQRVDIVDCSDLDAAGWRLMALSNLGELPGGTEPLTLSLLSVAMDCDQSNMPWVTEVRRG